MGGEQVADWSVLEIEGVAQVAHRAALRVAGKFKDDVMISYDDMLQEARIILATKPEMVRECLETEGLTLGVLHTRLVLDLTDLVKTGAGKAVRRLSMDVLLDGAE